VSDGSIFYIYGIVMSVIAAGFYLNALQSFENHARQLGRLIFSISAAWVLSVSFIGGAEGLFNFTDLQFNWFLFVVVYLFPFTAFIGFQLALYKLLDD
jgi:hypothetical protein